MIIKDDKSVEPQPQQELGEALPPYTPSTTASSISGTSSSTASTPTDTFFFKDPSIPKTNFVHIRRENNPVKESFFIDPTLVIPENLLPELPEGRGHDHRKNLAIDCNNASISADIWIANGDEGDVSKSKSGVRSELDIRGRNGSVTVKVHSSRDRPFNLEIAAHNGPVTLYIPESYTGPLTITTRNGWVSFSRSLAPNVMTFSDVKGTKKCFVGDFSTSNYGRGEWPGSKIDIDCHNGKVRLYYIEETSEAYVGRGNKDAGILSRLFGPR